MCQEQEKEMEKLKINVEETAKNYSKLEGFEDGRYPDPINPDAYLKKYYNWP